MRTNSDIQSRYKHKSFNSHFHGLFVTSYPNPLQIWSAISVGRMRFLTPIQQFQLRQRK